MVSTSTLFTLNNVTNSTITLVGVTYGNSRANAYNYNYNVMGSSVGLQWTNQQYTGALTGAANTEDDTAQQHILWEPVGCSTFTSITSSSWSVSSTWDSGVVPTSCNPVVIGAGTKVWVDISTATASTTTINGDLYFSRGQSSTMTVVGGNVYVNAGGTLDLGTAADPIPSGSVTRVTLALGTTAGQYGLIVQTGGNFLVYGAAKTNATSATGGNVGPGSAAFTVLDATGWQNGDLISVDSQAVTITGISGNSITSILRRWASRITVRTLFESWI